MVFFVLASFVYIFTLVLKSLSITNLNCCASLESSTTFTIKLFVTCCSLGTLVSNTIYSPYASSGLFKYPLLSVLISSILIPSCDEA